MRTGSEYLRSLNDGRQVFVDGECVKDVTTHRAFREAVRSIARLYDIAAAPEMRERMTFVSPKTGEPVLRVHARLEAELLEAEASPETLDARMAEAAYRPFDLERGPLLRVVLFPWTAGERVMLLAVHHIVADFASRGWLRLEARAVLLLDVERLRRRAR